MAVSVADMNQIRVNVLGTTVDAPGAAWTTMPPANANTLNTAQRIINRAINELNASVGLALNGTVGFDDRFNGVVGNEEAGDQAAFAAIGSNLIQAVAALVAGGGVVQPTTLSLVFEFPDPLDTADYVDLVVSDNCTIPADLDGAEYLWMPEPDDMIFELTANSTVLGEIEVAAGNQVTLSGIGGDVIAGTTLRMTASSIVGGPISPNAKITVIATKKEVPPAAVGRFEFMQSTADTEWSIYHSLNQRIVSVQVLDDSGTVMVPSINYDTVNRVILSFARPRAGTAVVRT